MNALLLKRLSLSFLVAVMLSGCASYDPGWTHYCTLLCTNVNTGMPEEIQRIGKNDDGTAVCKPAKFVCDAGRSAACVNTANWTNNNEPLYKDCDAVSFGDCSKSCAMN
ncbi:hypothetical protein P2G88_10270 [Aliiglaciecola sp. CAU 1673]|uniref:hypothetical protein n=1 Tax=Aliiglaciecola sp. CAU 1673 TaxID=3032595 RepID=UPI0023DA463D|nr:hypothetical protein [Aliiglaciecola sp. CAU 1673]MDF2178633.1 hypothetical protein [Aliiglaciecola sp. CAU 1673]